MAKETKSKKEWILSFPLDTPAKEVAEALAKKGIEVTDKHVHVVRYNARRSDADKAPSKKRGKRKTNNGNGKRAPVAAPVAEDAGEQDIAVAFLLKYGEEGALERIRKAADDLRNLAQ